MDSKKIISYNLPYSQFSAKYGRLIKTRVLDLAFAMYFIDGMNISREELLQTNKLSNQYEVRKWCTHALHQYYDIPLPNRQIVNLAPKLHFTLVELRMREMLTESQIELVAHWHREHVNPHVIYKTIYCMVVYGEPIEVGIELINNHADKRNSMGDIQEYIEAIYSDIDNATFESLDNSAICFLLDYINPC